MSPPHKPHSPGLSPAECTGLGAFGIAFALALADPRLAAVPLTLFVLLCAIMPFVHTKGFFLPVVSRGRSRRPEVAITFDDGPHPATTPKLLALLARHQAPATFFVTGRKAELYPGLVRTILDKGHTIGNHSYRHDNGIMLKSVPALKQDILASQRALRRLGVIPLAFRPPVGITNPRLARVLKESDLFVVNFSNSPRDWGNRRITRLSQRILKRLRPNDIIMLHDTPPHNPALFNHWLAEIDRVLTGIPTRGLSIVPLGDLIQRPVMRAHPHP